MSATRRPVCPGGTHHSNLEAPAAGVGDWRSPSAHLVGGVPDDGVPPVRGGSLDNVRGGGGIYCVWQQTIGTVITLLCQSHAVDDFHAHSRALQVGAKPEPENYNRDMVTSAPTHLHVLMPCCCCAVIWATRTFPRSTHRVPPGSRGEGHVCIGSRAIGQQCCRHIGHACSSREGGFALRQCN